MTTPENKLETERIERLKQRFPRFSIGESLLANTLEFIDQAGMIEAVLAKGFQFKNGAAFAYEDRYAEFNFAEKSSPGYPFTFQVQRSEFDQVLANLGSSSVEAKVRGEVQELTNRFPLYSERTR